MRSIALVSTVVGFLFIALAVDGGTGTARRSLDVALPDQGITSYYVDPGRAQCSYLDDYIVGQWKKHYVPNYRGWAELGCEVAVAVAGSRSIKSVRARSTSTSAAKTSALKEEAIEAAKILASELGCSVISKQSGWDLIRVWDGSYYRTITSITGYWHPGGYCYAKRETTTEFTRILP